MIHLLGRREFVQQECRKNKADETESEQVKLKGRMIFKHGHQFSLRAYDCLPE